MSASNKGQVVSYLESIIERLSKEGFDPSDEDLDSKIVPSVISSMKRLSAGAPMALREKFKVALTAPREPGKVAFQEKVQECLDEVVGEGGTEDPDDDEMEKADQPEEQHPDPEPAPTEEELGSYAKIVARLWAIDEPYRLAPDEHYKLNHQSRAGGLDQVSGDRASDPLFEKVDEARFMKNPCSAAFMSLLDNYEREDDVAENISGTEKMEMDNFLRRLMKTPHMKYIHKVLVSWGVADRLPRKFAAQIFEIWFSTYSMHGARGAKTSSGFEHVFVGEEKQKPGQPSQIVGFHNWIQFWREEKAKRVNYRGYVGTLNADDDRVVSVRFDWADDDAEQEAKNISTFVVGTSVAFEFAMLTCAFLGFGGETKTGGIYLGDIGPMQVTTYKWDTPLGTVVRSAYLEG